MTEYLLDTNVIRALNPDTVKLILANRHRARLTSSFHVPFEILSGLLNEAEPAEDLEKDYRIRRSAMRRYRDLIGTENTYWDLPSSVIARAFGRQPLSRAKEAFLVIILSLIECENREEFTNVLKSARALSSEMPTLEMLHEIDSMLGERVLGHLNKNLNFMRSRLKEFFEPRWFRPYMFLNFAEMAGVQQIDVKQLRVAPEEYLTNQTLNLRPVYDGTLNIMIEATRLYLKNLHRDHVAIPDRNDPIDLQHLSYLRPNDLDQFLVTMDRAFRHLVNHVDPGRAISMKEFTDLMTRD